MKLEDPIFNTLLKYTKALSVALGYRDLLTRLHSERVQGLAGQIGKHHGLSNGQMNILKIAASFHDIGKIGIPDSILLKPSKLSPAEWELMQQHSAIGQTILASMELDGSQEAGLLIRHHHEYYNGAGYPDKLARGDIPLCSRIISIADSYDAMAMTRSYHRARTHAEIMVVLREETGGKHDPAVMRSFCEIIDDSEFKAPRM